MNYPYNQRIISYIMFANEHVRHVSQVNDFKGPLVLL